MPTVFLDGATGAQAVADALGSNVNATSLFDSMVPFIPWIAGIVGFAFVYNRLIKRPVKKVQNGRAGI